MCVCGGGGGDWEGVSFDRNQVITTNSRVITVNYIRNQVITTDSRFEGQLHQKPGGHDEHHHSRHAGRDSKGVAS